MEEKPAAETAETKVENEIEEVNVLRKTTRKSLECKLTDPELKELSKELAEAHQAKRQAEDRLDSFKSQVKAEISASEAVISRNVGLIKSEHEYREIDVEIVLDFRRGMKDYYRLDTGELYKTERLEPEERQLELKIIEDKAEEEKNQEDEAAAAEKPE